uniref:hypothetical protein n=1 Tax=Klebsiella aerogenes TaxID=548 RepID=UPI00195390DF
IMPSAHGREAPMRGPCAAYPLIRAGSSTPYSAQARLAPVGSHRAYCPRRNKVEVGGKVCVCRDVAGDWQMQLS